jgi:hypothetical protein
VLIERGDGTYDRFARLAGVRRTEGRSAPHVTEAGRTGPDRTFGIR